MRVWICIVVVLVVMIAFRIFFPVFVALWSWVRTLSHANSPEFRLSMPNLWTEIQHVKGGGSSQMMKIDDGNIILMSVGLDTTKVFVTPRLDSLESFTEIASFPIRRSRRNFHSEGEAILNELRKAIGWPKTVEELRQTLSSLAGKVFQ